MLEVIFDSNGVRTTLHDTANLSVLSEESNAASKFTCKVFPTDESFDNIFPKITDVIAYDSTVNDVVFQGIVISSKPTFEAGGSIYNEVTCASLVSLLSTAVVVGFEDTSQNLYTIVSRILDIYNETAPEHRKIYIGTAPQGWHPEPVRISSATCFDALMQVVVTDVGYEFRTRYHDGRWYLDVNDDFGEYSTTTSLITGVNLTDISRTIDSSDLYTRIVPIGGASYIPPNMVNPVMSTEYEPDGMPLTLYGYDQEHPERIYIANEELETKYPPLTKVVQYDDIVAKEEADFYVAQANLYNRAVEDAKRLTDIIEEYSTTAIDLARAGYNYDFITMNTMYHIINHHLNIDTYLKVTSKKTDYSNPARCELTFGHISHHAAKYLSKKGKSTDRKIQDVGSASYSTTNTRMGGMSLRNQTSAEYDTSTHYDNTLYTVRDTQSGKVKLYLGDDEISGRGGGVVENAAIVTTHISDILINQELMMDITPATKMYYGGVPQFAVVQGHYCLLSAKVIGQNDITYDSEEEKWLIWGDDELYDAIVANKNKFGTQLGTPEDYGLFFGGLGTSADGTHQYPLKYTAIIPEISQLTNSSTGWDTRITYRRWLADNTQPAGEWYGHLTHPTATRESITFTTASLMPRTPNNGNYGTWSSAISDFFIVPVISALSFTETSGRDYGFVTLDQYLFFATASDYNGKYSVTRMTFNGNITNVPLISEAENVFMRGLYKRSEPREES